MWVEGEVAPERLWRWELRLSAAGATWACLFPQSYKSMSLDISRGDTLGSYLCFLKL